MGFPSQPVLEGIFQVSDFQRFSSHRTHELIAKILWHTNKYFIWFWLI